MAEEQEPNTSAASEEQEPNTGAVQEPNTSAAQEPNTSAASASGEDDDEPPQNDGALVPE